MSPRRRKARATRKLVEWHQRRLAVLLTAYRYRGIYRKIRKFRATLDRLMGSPRENPVGRTFDVCGAKVTVREQIGDALIVDVLPPICPVQFITVNVNIDPPTSMPAR